MPLIQARNLFKTYRLGRVDVPVLKGVSLAVEPGECVAILGRSGSGKSTLLHLLGGLDRPDKPRARLKRCAACREDVASVRASDLCPRCNALIGERPRAAISFDGRNLAAFSAGELNRFRNRSVGFVFQFYHLFPELTVLENVLIGAMIGAAPGVAERARARSLLERVGLSHRLRHRPAELSGGERQRVAIARALINQPPLLLADEPTGNLDAQTGAAILDLLGEVRTEGRMTMLIVTHDQTTAARADRVLRLDDGRITDTPCPAPIGYPSAGVPPGVERES